MSKKEEKRRRGGGGVGIYQCQLSGCQRNRGIISAISNRLYLEEEKKKRRRRRRKEKKRIDEGDTNLCS
jgi:hypothetical protein